MAGGGAVIALSELRDAFDFVSAAPLGEHGAFICRETGKVYLVSGNGSLDEDEDPPDDLETSDRYIPVPHETELNLGRRLVMDFVRRELPAEYGTIAGFFRRRSAYSRFKNLLAQRGMLSRWYEFEEAATSEALLVWCNEVEMAVRP